MLSGVPDFAFCVGYVNASWTLRTEISHRFVCRLLAYLDEHGLRSATPVAPPGLSPQPLLDLTSGYVLRSVDRFPKRGDRQPWLLPQNWFADRRAMARARVEQVMTFVAGVDETARRRAG